MGPVKWLLGLATAATLGWGGLWFAGARGLDQALAQALDDPRAPIRAEGHVVRGFPNRFDITLTEPRLAEAGLTWSAPFVQVFALSYRPHHVIVVFPHQQDLDLSGLPVRIDSRDARASLVMRPTEGLALDRAALVVQMPVVTLPGQRLSADALRLALRPTDGPGRYEAVAEIEALFPDPGLLDRLDPDGHLPRRLDVLRLDAALRFAHPLDLDALRGGMAPRLADVALTGARLVADGIDLQAEGRIAPDPRGRPTGEVTLHITGWRALLERLGNAGLAPPEVLAWIAAAAPALAQPDRPETLSLPLNLRDGQVRLGPLVLAELPRF